MPAAAADGLGDGVGATVGDGGAVGGVVDDCVGLAVARPVGEAARDAVGGAVPVGVTAGEAVGGALPGGDAVGAAGEQATVARPMTTERSRRRFKGMTHRRTRAP